MGGCLTVQLLVDDPLLLTWSKHPAPFIALPPASEPLTGWRDPFVIQRGGEGREWIILMGAGIKGIGGTTLIYKADALNRDWRYTGKLCTGNDEQGQMWECPLLALLPNVPGMSNDGGEQLSMLEEDRLDDAGVEHVFARASDAPRHPRDGHARPALVCTYQ